MENGKVRKGKMLIEEGIYGKLSAYGKSDFYPYHMPGHKRSRELAEWADIFQIDITEIDGFDNLHQAQGIIKQAQERASKLYGAEETFFLVNGSTCGILAAVMAATCKQDEILIARNCHKAVYHGALMQELKLHYLYPKQIAEFGIADAIEAAEVEEALQNYPQSKAVVITSPTYEGIIADIAAIAQVVHQYDKMLIVDEAHGAHLGLAAKSPRNAVQEGADIVIHSLHKTLPAMTQTALLHINGTRVNREKLRRYLGMVQTSSPSYVFMANMDSCISFMAKNADSYYERMCQHQKQFLESMADCKYLRVGAAGQQNSRKSIWDYGKLVISVKNTPLSGQQLYDILREEFHLQMEMAADSYVLAMMTMMDGEEGWQRLADALCQIDGRIEESIIAKPDKEAAKRENKAAIEKKQQKQSEDKPSNCFYEKAEALLTIAEAFRAVYEKGQGIEVPVAEAEGKIAGNFVNLYPPGIPILVPGEVIGKAQIEKIEESLCMGLCVQGITAQKKILTIPYES